MSLSASVFYRSFPVSQPIPFLLLPTPYFLSFNSLQDVDNGRRILPAPQQRLDHSREIYLRPSEGAPSAMEALPLLGSGSFGTLDDYYQCYSQTSFTSPAMQAHHLLNGIRMAVHRDPNSLLKFLDAMESCSLCGGVAGKMKEEYNSEFTIKANSHCTRFRPEVPINQWCCVKLDSFQLLRCVNGLYRTSGRNA